MRRHVRGVAPRRKVGQPVLVPAPATMKTAVDEYKGRFGRGISATFITLFDRKTRPALEGDARRQRRADGTHRPRPRPGDHLVPRFAPRLAPRIAPRFDPRRAERVHDLLGGALVLRRVHEGRGPGGVRPPPGRRRSLMGGCCRQRPRYRQRPRGSPIGKMERIGRYHGQA